MISMATITREKNSALIMLTVQYYLFVCVCMLEQYFQKKSIIIGNLALSDVEWVKKGKEKSLTQKLKKKKKRIIM
jgi:hypothetical protein